MATFLNNIFVFVAVLLLARPPASQQLDNNLARTPPMGWIAWERFTCTTACDEYPNDCINEALFRQMAYRMAQDGYKEAGYEYINIDDCWSEMERDQMNGGKLRANLARFPNGIDGLASYIHGKGLKLGIYGDCGTKTCGGYPAQLKSEEDLEDNHFQLDAETFAGWQIDSFKFDGCHLEAGKAESICPKMSLALNATGRPMVVICEWPFYMLDKHLQPSYSIAQKACNVFRYYWDVEDSWLSILAIVDFTLKMQLDIVKYHGPGHWFDPDQLIIGNFALSLDQARAQMALWCIWSAPLYMGNDLRSIPDEMAAVLKNRKLIGVDQDRLGVFGLMVEQTDNDRIQAFVKPVEPITNGCPSFVVAYLNRNTLGNGRDVSFSLRSLLSKAPISIAAHRFQQLHPNSSAAGVGQFSADRCKQLIRSAMTRDPNAAKLLVRPASQKVYEPTVEETVVRYEVEDLFDDEQHTRSVYLNDQLKLRVNPSGVRIVKLISHID